MIFRGVLARNTGRAGLSMQARPRGLPSAVAPPRQELGALSAHGAGTPASSPRLLAQSGAAGEVSKG
jgi:hypothetical protein